MTPQERQDVVRERLDETFKLDPQVKITLKGKEYTLEYNNFAAKNILKDTQVNLLAESISGAQLEDVELIGSLLFRGLQTNHPDLSLEDTDKLFTLQHYPYIMSQIRQAVKLFMPDLSGLVEDEVKDNESGDKPKDEGEGSRNPI